jgi:Protein of unknown function (DUF2752)
VDVERWFILAAALFAPAAAAILYFVEPTGAAWIPPCLLYKLTGIHCPFCGGTRGGHALLNGDLLQALAWNPLAVVLVPLAALWIYWAAWRALRHRPLPAVHPSTWVVRLFLLFLFVFWLVRNLPFYPCELLAPHKL